MDEGDSRGSRKRRRTDTVGTTDANTSETSEPLVVEVMEEGKQEGEESPFVVMRDGVIPATLFG